MSVTRDEKLHLWGRPFGGEWKYLATVKNDGEKNTTLENFRIALGSEWAFRFLQTKDHWHGRTFRMIGLNRNEVALVKTLLRNETLDITEPFQASQALIAIRTQRKKEGKSIHSGMPNKYRLNYIFKKTKIFDCSKAVNGNNLWTYKGGIE